MTRISRNSKTTADPATLLARGYTARYLGAVLNGKISALSQEEIERDLRHITAYQEAATRYHQLTYAATNRLVIPQDSAHSNINTSTTDSAYAVLPVRIDPEEEKRAQAAVKRIQRAEAVREELEQHYVALRAHYVVTTQELQQRHADFGRMTEFLQTAVQSTAKTLGLQRARLQLARDGLAALKLRTAILAEAEAKAAALEGRPPQITDPSVYASGADSCPMLAVWLAIEEDCKKLCGAPKTSSKKSKTASVVPWPCAVHPATARAIPLLLSAVSTVPEKSVAVQTGGVFGSHHSSMTWLERHVPDTVDEDGEDLLDAEASAVEALRQEVTYLEHELLNEREANQTLLVTTGKARTQHDEWVAMISLVRQETEAVLHRHNILLESDEVRDAAAALAAEEQDDDDDDEVEEDDEAEAEDVDGLEGDGASATASAQEAAPKRQQLPDEEGANEADDEGMVEEGEEADDWDSNNNNNNKRSATANDDSEESPGGSRKRRKV